MVFVFLYTIGLALMLLPMKALRLALGTGLASNAAYLAPATNGNKVALINAPFTPTENLTIAGLSFATFMGSAPLTCGPGTQLTGIDPLTQQQVITLLAPAGGFHWQCTAKPAAPESIFGFALVDNADAVLLGVQLLAQPLSISDVGHEVNLGDITIEFVLQPMD